MLNNRLFFKACFLLFFTSDISAFYLPSFVVPGDSDYQIIKADNQEVIYDANNTSEVLPFFQKAQNLHHVYEKSFGFALSQRNFTGLASAHNQISNGFATFFPLLMNGFYSGGAASIDYFGAISWLDELLIHEFSHTYQMDAKTGFSKSLQQVFGNNGLWFINPNYLLPTIIVEGNAVMNESRFGIGGRLYVGEHRALVYALSRDERLDYTRLLNNHLDFPYGREKYLVGGYLWAYIAKRFGTEKANSYFLQHATHYINPLRINRSFLEHFGVSYHKIVREFLRDLKLKSNDMKFLKGEEIQFSHFIGDLNADDKDIFWMQSDEVGPHQKVVFSKTGSYAIEKSTHLIDKLFKNHGRFYTASQAQIDPSHITSGLFDENIDLFPNSKDFFIFDARNGHEAAFYIPDSYSRAKLYKNRKFFAQVDSSPILDSEGNVYYAKQNGDLRTLYKNKIPITSWRGFSQKLCEVKGDAVYFIAPTLYGSSLFIAKEGRVFRMSEADNIVDARLINDSEFLAVTVRGDGYHIIKANIHTAQEVQPTWYEYDIQMQALSTFGEHNASAPQVYSPLKNLHYGFLNAINYVHSSSGGQGGGLGFVLMDPLHQNELNIGAFVYQSYASIHANYQNRQHLINYNIYASLEGSDSFGVTGYGGLGLSYPLFKHLRESWNVLLNTGMLMANDINSGTFMASLSYRYAQGYGIAYDWHHYKAFNVAYQYTDQGNSGAIDYSIIREPFRAFFLKANAAAYSSEQYVSTIRGTPLSNIIALYPQYMTVNSSTMSLLTHNAIKASMTAAYAFKSGLYFDVWPFSLRRTAFSVGGNYYGVDGELNTLGDVINANAFDFYEVKAGIDFEILGFHLQAFNCEIAINYNSYLDETEYTLRLGINY